MTVLNLGCGLDYRIGAVNADEYDLTVSDLQASALRLPLADRSVARIEARHLVEHLGYAGTVYALAEWVRVLAPGGTLVLETPDRNLTCLAAAQIGVPAQALHWLFGLPSPGYTHRTLFDEQDLYQMAKRAGFANIEVSQTEAFQPSLSLVARKGSNSLADLRARLHLCFAKAGVIEPLSAPPHLAHLENICDRILSSVESIPRNGLGFSIAEIFGTTVRYTPTIATSTFEVLMARNILPESETERYLSIAHSLAEEAFAARMTAFLRQQPAVPGTQETRLRRLDDVVSLYLTARLYPHEKGLMPGIELFEAASQQLVSSDREIEFFCAESVRSLSKRETARGVRAFAIRNLIGARRHLELAMAYDSDYALPVWNLARVALTEGHRLEALRLYASLLEIWPEGADTLGQELDTAAGRSADTPIQFTQPTQPGEVRERVP